MAGERTFLAWIRAALAFAATRLGDASLLDEFPWRGMVVGLLMARIGASVHPPLGFVGR